jgi:hypothetical protein
VSAETADPTPTAEQSAPSAVPVGRLRGDLGFVSSLAALAVLLRFPGLFWPLMPDESGFTLVARHWHPTADNIYGTYWVDRPPILIGLFRLSDWLGGPYAPRVAGCLLAVGMAVAAYRAGLLIGGRTTARWTGVACLALMSQPDFTMWSAKSESLGVPFAMASCMLTVETLYRPTGRARVAAAAGAGVLGAMALGMKQSLFGPEVFCAVALIWALRGSRLTPGEARRAVTAAVAGFAAVVAATLVWAIASGVRLSAVWEMLYGFRSEAFHVITEGDMTAPLDRAGELVHLFLVTGMVVVVLWFGLAFRGVYRAHRELALATALMLVIDAVSLSLSGSYWASNIVPLIPSLTIALALALSSGGRRSVVSRLVATGLATSCGYLLTSFVVTHTVGDSGGPTAHYTGEAIAAVADPHDTIVLLYGRADIVLASGLDDPYEHLWSLPTRTLDPELTDLKALVRSPRAPTWIVEWSDAGSFGLDPDGSFRALLEQRYIERPAPCEGSVWLRKGVDRPAFPAVDCAAHWFAWD